MGPVLSPADHIPVATPAPQTAAPLDAGLLPAAPALAPDPAATQLVRVEDAVGWIAEGLGVGCDPVAVGK